MFAIKHFGIVVGYGAFAVFAAIAIPIWVPSLGAGVGTALFVLAVLVHDLFIRRNRELALQNQIDALCDGCNKLEVDFNRLQKRYDELREGPGEFAPNAFDHQRRLRRVKTELRVLRTLKNQTSVSEDSEPSVVDDGAASAQRSEAPDLCTDFSEAQMLNIVREALKHDRIDLFLQPVVKLPQRTPRYYECYSRIRAADGSRVKPAHYIEFAKERGLLGGIDNMLLFRCIQLVRKAQRHNHNLGFFCNISVQTIEDRKFFPHFIAFLAENRKLASRLTFELGQGDIEFQWDAIAGEMEKLADLGFRFSLDGIKNLGFDAAQMANRHFTFAKVEAQALLSRAGESGENVRRFRQELGRNHIELIVEKVETQRQLMELLDLDICLAQGFLFGEPRLSRGG